MVKKILGLFIFFWFLTLVEASFLIHFSVFDIIPNLIFLSVIAINIFEKTQNKTGIFAGFIGGFFLDIWSSLFFGAQILILTSMSILIKMIVKKYVWS
ncbi:MAG: hypothetical protein U9Q27_02950 [Patescibacteria group bacterium]|nr:hypothetical protein [Patescibacteria group bacterium]